MKFANSAISKIVEIIREGMIEQKDATEDFLNLKFSEDEDECKLDNDGQLFLSNEILMCFANAFNMSFITGTDIREHIYLINLETSENKIYPTKEYLKMREDNVEKLAKEVELLQQEQNQNSN